MWCQWPKFLRIFSPVRGKPGTDPYLLGRSCCWVTCSSVYGIEWQRDKLNSVRYLRLSDPPPPPGQHKFRWLNVLKFHQIYQARSSFMLYWMKMHCVCMQSCVPHSLSIHLGGKKLLWDLYGHTLHNVKLNSDSCVRFYTTSFLQFFHYIVYLCKYLYFQQLWKQIIPILWISIKNPWPRSFIRPGCGGGGKKINY